MDKIIPIHFEASFDSQGGLRPTSDPELFICRVRAFYKYSNRNGSYITDEFANELAESAYLKPVFGRYLEEGADFLGHEGPREVKAYGFVLPDSLVWEEHLDDDGVTREYATYDVMLWANYWDEAKTILEKGQSMEIDPQTVQGEWRRMGGPVEEYVYSKGVMAGLCVLGNLKVPCFEGAAFFSMDDDCYVKFTQAIQKYYNNDGGKNAMHVKVAGLEHENFMTIFSALNPNFNEEGAYSFGVLPCEIGEDYFFALACDTSMKLQKYSYHFEEDQFVHELVEETDYKAVAAEFEAFKNEATVAAETAQNNYSELNNKYEAIVAEKETLENDKLTIQNSFEEMKNNFEALQNSFNELQNNFNAQAEAMAAKDSTISEYSAQITEYENKEKEAIIAKFSACLPAETLQEITDKKDTLSITELNTELALEYTKFSMAKEQGLEIHIPQVKPTEESDLAKILKNYKK